jgi:hypothetical protein
VGNERLKTADEEAAEAANLMFKGGRGAMGGAPITTNLRQTAPEPLEKGGGAGGMPTAMGGALGGLAAKAPGAPLAKGDEEEDKDKEEKEEENGEDLEKEKSCKKSEEPAEKSEPAGETVDLNSLMKSMDALDAAASGVEEEDVDRRAELAKALADGTLTEDERDELFGLLGGQAPAPASEAVEKSEDPHDEGETVEKGFDEVFSDEFSEDYDASPFIEKFGHTVGASLDIIRDDMSKSFDGQQTFNRALAKSFRGVATLIQRQEEMIKSLSSQNTALAERLGMVEQQPVGRKSVSHPSQVKPLQKSFADSDPADGLNRKDIFEGLHRLMTKYKDTGGRAACGEPIDRAVSSFELTGQISKSMLGEVEEILQTGK